MAPSGEFLTRLRAGGMTSDEARTQLDSLPVYTPLGKWAKALGVGRLIATERIPEAAVARDNGSYTVLVNPRRPRTRQRFSVAHELAHIIIDPRLRFECRSVPTASVTDDALERDCDSIAARILMPARVFRRDLHTTKLNARALVRLSHKYETSYWATSRRVAELSDVPLACFQTSVWDDGRLRIDWGNVTRLAGGKHGFVPNGKSVGGVASVVKAAYSDGSGQFVSRGHVDLGTVRGSFPVSSVRVAPTSRPRVLSLAALWQPLAVK